MPRVYNMLDNRPTAAECLPHVYYLQRVQLFCSCLSACVCVCSVDPPTVLLSVPLDD